VMPEILDMTLVMCDGRRALADFDCWSTKLAKVVSVRTEYELGAQQLTVVTSEDLDLAAEVASSGECLADAREAVLYQRDVNREKN